MEYKVGGSKHPLLLAFLLKIVVMHGTALVLNCARAKYGISRGPWAFPTQSWRHGSVLWWALAVEVSGHL